MPSLAARLRRAAALPPRVLLRKASEKLWQMYDYRSERFRDLHACTYLKDAEAPCGPLLSHFDRFPADAVSDPAPLAAVATRYLAHRFDLLGSGWTQVRHGMSCRGLEGRAYQHGQTISPDPSGVWLERLVTPANGEESRRIWLLIDRAYQPIDWQLDFKSGYRWSERTWYRDVVYGNVAGVDVKVPWELARMQHLPQLAGGAALDTRGSAQGPLAEACAREFRNQVLDFIATNPPRFGVNWTTSMDVGIRVANWLVAYDLFRAGGATFEPDFDSIFIRSVLEHGRHIVTNLEWTPELRGNHYLADLVGLLFVASYLPPTAETRAWLAFAIQELIAEAELQFLPDGTNFEASTCYHRLSAELLIYATALVLGLSPEQINGLGEYDHRQLGTTPPLKPAPMALHQLRGTTRRTPFPAWYLERIERMAQFTLDITKPGGRVPQIGDNDSGRFLKLFPALHPIPVADARSRYANLEGYSDLPGEAIYWVEDHLDHRHLVAAVNGLFARPDFAAFAAPAVIESRVVAVLAGITVPSVRCDRPAPAESVRIGVDGSLDQLERRLTGLGGGHYRRLGIPLPYNGARDGIQLLAYPDFGLYLVRSSRLYLAVRCGPIGQNGFGGHAHNDQLHLELAVDGANWIADPGTYVYTPLPSRRNAYRSTRAHFVPRFMGGEPASLDLGLFRLGAQSRAECLYWGADGFAGAVQSEQRTAYAIVRLEDDHVVVIHATEGARLEGPAESSHWRELLPVVPYSPGYGMTIQVA